MPETMGCQEKQPKSSQPLKWPPDQGSRRRGSYGSLEKKHKDDDNRLIQDRQRKSDDATERKQRYGGEENEEKTDPSKDTSSDEDLTTIIDTQKYGYKETEAADRSEKGEKSFESEVDNKIADSLENHFQAVVKEKNMARLLERSESIEKQPPYFEVGFILGQSHEENKTTQWNTSEGMQFQDCPEFLQIPDTTIMDSLAMAEGNFLFPMGDNPVWNIPPSDKQNRNLEKHLSNIINELSSLAMVEGMDNKIADNKLTSLWDKLTTKLTAGQIRRITDAIEMKRERESLPALLNFFNLLSDGGDYVLPVKSDELSPDPVSAPEKDDITKDQVRSFVTMTTEHQLEKSSFEIGSVKETDGHSESTDEDEDRVEEDEKPCDVDASDKVEEVEGSLDKSQGEGMEKEDVRPCQTYIDDDAVIDDEGDKDEASKSSQVRPGVAAAASASVADDEKADAPQSSGTRSGRRMKSTLKRKAKFELHLGMDEDASIAQFVDASRLKEHSKKRKNYKFRNKGHVKWSTITILEEKRVDLRKRFCRTRSCMDCGESGGGNSPSSNKQDNSGRQSNHNKDGNDDERAYNNSSNNNNNNDSNNSKGSGSADKTDYNQPRQDVVDKNIPGQDYKAFRKKHSMMTDGQLLDLLGSLSPDTGPSRKEDPMLLCDVNHCLLLLLHELPTDSDLACSVCVVLHSLLSHFGTCQSAYMKCSVCWQLLRLCLYHVQKCIVVGKEKKESQSDVCQQLIKAANHNAEAVETQSQKLWTKMKKYVISVFNPQGLHASGQHGMYEESAAGLSCPSIGTSSIGDSIRHIGLSINGQSNGSSPSLRQGDTVATALGPAQNVQNNVMTSSANGTFNRLERVGSKRFQSSLKSIPERPSSFQRQSFRNRKGRQNRLASSEGGDKESIEGRSDTTEDIKDNSLESQPQSSQGELEAGFLSLPTPTDASSRSSFGAADDPSAECVSSGPNEERGDSAMQVIYTKYKPMMDTHGNIFPNETRAGKPDSDFPKTYGPTGVMSLPPRPNNPHEGTQMMSLVTAPTGEPGIGEVVYGTHRQIMKVARHWAWVRENKDHEEVYTHQLREEGVILDSAKKDLRILKTRYQKKLQWMRLVHLGNGVAGKCHLAHDTTSDFKFCVKRIHIAKYEENELVTWSDLDNPNIVRLYGAIRHGCKVYIFCEFIAGGSLTSLINEQRSLNRRLSHWMCLRYFKQLLMVLVYLKSRNVLHEDLKADNVLIKRNSTLIAVADFGLARRMNVDSEMKGMTPTGTQSQWSPEKATSDGHGFAADVWAATCILVHMLSGHPPWTKRYPSVQMLHYVIFTQSPPLVDVPANIQDVMTDLITQAFTVDPALRPSAADLLKHRAFQILDQGAPESYYSTFLSSGQALPNNMLDSSTKGTREMQDILASLGTARPAGQTRDEKDSTTTSNKEKDGLVPQTSGVLDHPRNFSMTSTSIREEDMFSRREGLSRSQGIMVETASGSLRISDESMGISGNAGNQTGSLRSGQGQLGNIRSLNSHSADSSSGIGITGVPGAGTVEPRDERESMMAIGGQIEASNLPQTLWDASLQSEENGSNYAISSGLYKSPDDCFNRFLNDDLFVSTTPSSCLREYQPPARVGKTFEVEPVSPFALPDWKELLGEDLTFSGITLEEQSRSDMIASPKQQNPQNFQEAYRENTQSSGERHISPTELMPSDTGMHDQPSHVPMFHLHDVEDPYPTSYYPPSNLYEEHINSDDLFDLPASMLDTGQGEPPSHARPIRGSPPRIHSGDHRGSTLTSPMSMPVISTFLSQARQRLPAVRGFPNQVVQPSNHSQTHKSSVQRLLVFPGQGPSSIDVSNLQFSTIKQSLNAETTEKTRSTNEFLINSLETNVSGEKESASQVPKNVSFNQDVTSVDIEDQKFLANIANKPRSASASQIQMLHGGTPDFAMETLGKEFSNLDLPDDIQIGGDMTEKQICNEAGERQERKKLTLDVNRTPKKSYNRNQSQPAFGTQTTVESMPHPKTCPGGLEHYKGSFTGKKTESSSGIGTSISYGDSRQTPPHNNEPWTPSRLSSSEMSPSTPKSLFDHQEKVFIALERASQSDKSGHDERMMAMAEQDLQDESGDGQLHTDLDSFENQLASIQKTIPDEAKDLGHKYQLYRADDSPLSPIRVPARFEEWSDVIDLIRQIVTTEDGLEHFTLRQRDDAPIDYNAPLIQCDMDIKVCAIEGDPVDRCWCEHHEDMLRVMA